MYDAPIDTSLCPSGGIRPIPTLFCLFRSPFPQEIVAGILHQGIGYSEKQTIMKGVKH